MKRVSVLLSLAAIVACDARESPTMDVPMDVPIPFVSLTASEADLTAEGVRQERESVIRTILERLPPLPDDDLLLQSLRGESNAVVISAPDDEKLAALIGRAYALLARERELNLKRSGTEGDEFLEPEDVNR